MDTAQWPQEMGLVKPMDGMMPSSSTTTATTRPPQLMEKRVRPQKEQALNCPRCNSTNTKFCYYNNYSLTQPRYFCKNCRRYWTEGGSLRNVPVGGGSRKNKRSSSSSLSNTNTNTSSLNPSSTTITTTTAPSRKLPTDLTPPPISLSSTSSQNPKFHEGQDLNLAFPHHSLAEFGDFQNIETSSSRNCGNPSTASRALSAMELLRSGINVRGPGPYMPMPMPMPDTSSVYPSGFALHDFRPLTLNFPGGGGGGGGGGYGGLQGVHEGGDRLLFPFEDLKQGPSNTAEFEQNRGQGGDPPGFWNGMVGGGGSW